ncbi:unnamed protein product [Caenorhabditis auriculariae]|uniref:EGF-like domain-containing protein n=1 Tax=Caenorhabditis auriculariae TaxID=2777116 RepID=A0A8S1GZI7_9PELO|nr:unnamed protein product [Caenorhabditis auriculariae]
MTRRKAVLDAAGIGLNQHGAVVCSRRLGRYPRKEGRVAAADGEAIWVRTYPNLIVIELEHLEFPKRITPTTPVQRNFVAILRLILRPNHLATFVLRGLIVALRANYFGCSYALHNYYQSQLGDVRLSSTSVVFSTRFGGNSDNGLSSSGASPNKRSICPLVVIRRRSSASRLCWPRPKALCPFLETTSLIRALIFLMCCFFSLLLLLASAAVVHSNVVNYRIHDLNDNEVNECVERAMEYLMDETCLFFSENLKNTSLQSPSYNQREHCAWQASNRTVHLGPSCISEDTCLNLLASMLDANFPRHQIVTQINLRYNCTEKCTTVCEHGGELRDDCTCKCEYGFTGQRCENLARESSFTDSSCGIVDSKASGGVVSLSTFPDSRPKITFCQWLIKTDDAWGLVDAEIEVLGLDDVNVSPDQNCNDRLNFYGTKDVKGNDPMRRFAEHHARKVVLQLAAGRAPQRSFLKQQFVHRPQDPLQHHPRAVCGPRLLRRDDRLGDHQLCLIVRLVRRRRLSMILKYSQT